MEESLDRSEHQAPITAEEHGELYDALAAHPLWAFTIRGVTREEYIERLGQLEPVVIEDEETEQRVLAMAAEDQARRQRLADLSPGLRELLTK